MSFADYIEASRHIIANGRADLTPATQNKIIEANSPFQWLPENSPKSPSGKHKNGILLVHGLMDSPFSLRDLGQYFYAKDFLVRSILLPGHGTVPGDLTEVDAMSWHRAVSYGIEAMSMDVENIYLLGFSGGATLSLCQAFNNAPIKGLFLFAPSVKLTARFAWIARWLHHAGKLFPRCGWYVLKDDSNYAKYESCPYNMAYQAYRITQDLAKLRNSSTLTIPMFMVLSDDDETIDSDAAKRFFLRQPEEKNRLLIYSKKEQSCDDIGVEYRNSSYPEQQILDFSHVCLLVPPDNPHYGKYGDYFPPPRFLGKADNRPVYAGALSKENMRSYATRRLTYNPDYDYMTRCMDDFIAKVCD
tara:strand:+ start:9772 stop:10848 length:1077 start_codon:yes stop_codon:yes gene_type:complete